MQVNFIQYNGIPCGFELDVLFCYFIICFFFFQVNTVRNLCRQFLSKYFPQVYVMKLNKQNMKGHLKTLYFFRNYYHHTKSYFFTIICSQKSCVYLLGIVIFMWMHITLCGLWEFYSLNRRNKPEYITWNFMWEIRYFSLKKTTKHLLLKLKKIFEGAEMINW